MFLHFGITICGIGELHSYFYIIFDSLLNCLSIVNRHSIIQNTLRLLLWCVCLCLGEGVDGSAVVSAQATVHGGQRTALGSGFFLFTFMLVARFMWPVPFPAKLSCWTPKILSKDVS